MKIKIIFLVVVLFLSLFFIPIIIKAEIVESANNIGAYSSIALDTNGVSHISHFDDTNNDIRYCNNTGGSWSCGIVASGGNVGEFTSLAIDSTNVVHISAYNSSGTDPMYCENSGGTWSCEDVEKGAATMGQYTSIAIDTNDKVHITHRDATNHDVRYCNNTGGSWSCLAVTRMENGGDGPELAINSSNDIHITFLNATNTDLGYCENSGGTWACSIIESSGLVGQDPYIAIDSNDIVHITHHDDGGGDLRYCNNTAGSWSCGTIETANDVGDQSAIAIDSSDKLHVTFLDSTNGDLRYCNNTAGSWSCSVLTDLDSPITVESLTGRQIAIKKGRIVDSYLFSSRFHVAFINDSNLAYLNQSFTSQDELYLFGCGALTSEGTYTLQNNVSSTGTCFTISANDIILDGNGYTVDFATSSSGYGVYLENRNNILIKNLKVSSTRSSSDGIYVDSSGIVTYPTTENITINNCEIRVTGSGSNGIHVPDTSTGIGNMSIINCPFISSSDDALFFDEGNFGYGELKINNSIFIGGAGAGDNGIDISDLQTSEIRDSNFSAVVAVELNKGVNDFINCTFDKEVVLTSTLNRKWYVDINITDENLAALNEANTTAYNNSKNVQFSINTTATGLIPRQSVIQYVNASGTTNSYNDYDFNATKAGYDSNGTTVTVTDNQNLHIIIPGADAPSISLDVPINNSFLNYATDIYFNYTASDVTGLDTCELWGNWTGTWHRNITWVNPTDNVQNFTSLNISDGTYIWNMWCNDTSSLNGFNESNYTLTIDTIQPIIPSENISLGITAGSQTVDMNITGYTEINCDSSWYSVYDSTGTIENSIENISLTSCSELNASITVNDPPPATYNFTVYMNDSAGNENSTTTSFSTTVITTTGGGGGGTSTVETAKIAIIQPLNTIELSNLQRAIMFSRIFELCDNNPERIGSCILTNNQKENLTLTLSEQTIDINLEELEPWLVSFRERQFEEVLISQPDIKKFNLFVGVLAEVQFIITSQLKDRFFLAFSDVANYQALSNRVLKSCEIVNGELGFSCNLDPDLDSVAIITYKLPERADFSFRNVQTTISFTDVDDNTIFLNTNLRIITPRGMIIIVVILVLGISIISFRKRIFKFFKKIR